MCVDSVTVTPIILLCTFTLVVRRMTLTDCFYLYLFSGLGWIALTCSMVEAVLFLHVQWFRLDCSYMFSSSGWIVLTCSVVQAGLFLHVQWFRLDCSYVFSGSGWIVFPCSVVQAGLLLHVQWFRLDCSGWLRPVPHTSW